MKTYALTANKKIGTITRSLYAVILVIICTMPCSSAHAAVMPEFVRLDPVAGNINDPVAVAVDRNGGLYVLDADSASVVVFSQGGRYAAKLTGLDSPISLAVDTAGRILVGSKDKGSVAVYDADFNLLFKLGSGDGEFVHPIDICVDVTGRIYVVDKGMDTVRMYDASGRPTGFIGSSGNGDGQFNHPVSICIDEAAEEIIVLDRQIVPGTSREGSRIQYYDMSGTFLRSFSKNGDQIGDLFRPQDIGVDNAGRLYITDSRENVVLVYDSTGVYLDAIFDLTDPFRTPLGITIGMNNRLYVASRMAKCVEVYGIDNYLYLVVDPVRLKFTAREGKESPAAQSISLLNVGNTAVHWIAEPDASWLSLSDKSAVLEADQAEDIEVAVDTAGLGPGEYTGSVTVSAGPGAAEVVRISLTVVPSAKLAVAPAALSITAEAGTVSSPLTFTVANIGDAPLYWSMYADQPWIGLSEISGILADSGAVPVPVSVTADVTALAAGSYSGIITIIGHDALASPAAIGVTLTVTAPAKPPDDEYPPTPPPGTSWNGNFGRKWSVAAQLDGVSLNGIWGGSGAEIFVVGDKGTILHYAGGKWKVDDSGTSSNLNGVWGSSPTGVYAVGDDGLVLHYDGDKWSGTPQIDDILYGVWSGREAKSFAVGRNTAILVSEKTGTWIEDNIWENFGSLYGIWGSSEEDIYVVGSSGLILHHNGASWEQINSGTTMTLYDVWGSAADDVYAVGQAGTVLHYDGTEWSPMDSGTTLTLAGIWGNAANEVYAAGEDGTLILYRGATWDKLKTGIGEDLNDVWGSRRKEVYAVGSGGSILHGSASFPWRLLLPALEYNAKQGRLSGR